MNGGRCNVYPLAIAMSVLMLSACSDTPFEESDRAPTRQIAAHEVIEPSPRPDPILAAGNTSPYVVHRK